MSFPFADVVARLSSLSSAIIDTSSLIYLSKINCLPLLIRACKLFTIPDVTEEFGNDIDGIAIIKDSVDTMETDQKLIQICITNKLPLISEDRKLLREAERYNLPYYNSLMILNFLLVKKKIRRKEYASLLEKLKSVARYGKDVWKFGELVHSFAG